MRIIADGDRGYLYNARFVGKAELEMLREAITPADPDVARLHYFDGAVTKWHTHPGGQLIYVVSGRGRIGNTFGEHDLCEGTLVEVPAGERHWHGAAPGSDSVFLFSTWGATRWSDEAPEVDA